MQFPNNKIALKNVRLSFNELEEPKAFQNGDGPKKYQACFILDPKSSINKSNLADLETLINRVTKEKWGKAPAKLKSWVLQDGNESLDKEDEIREETKDKFIVTASNAKRPFLLDIDGDPLSVEETRQLYSGCNVSTVIQVFAYDNKFGKGISAQLCTVKFHSDNDAFGAAANVSQDLELLSDDEAIDSLI